MCTARRGCSESLRPPPFVDYATTSSLRAFTLGFSTHAGRKGDAVSVGVARHPRCGRAGDQRLRGDAAVVNAGATEMLALDDRGLTPRASETHGQWGTSSAGPLTMASEHSATRGPRWGHQLPDPPDDQSGSALEPTGPGFAPLWRFDARRDRRDDAGRHVEGFLIHPANVVPVGNVAKIGVSSPDLALLIFEH